MEIRQASGRRVTKDSLLNAEHPVQYGVREGRGQWGQDGGKRGLCIAWLLTSTNCHCYSYTPA